MYKSAYYFLRDILYKRTVIYELVKRDVQQQYTGSYLGAIWIFLQPLLFVSVLYAVFTLGFRAGNSVDMPFAVYLILGILPWMYFSRNLVSNTEVIGKYSFMVKKVDFRLSVLPIVTMLGALIPHLFLMLIAIALSWHQGFPPSIYTFQLLYYFFAMFTLLLGLAWLTSSSSLFIKDVSNVVSVLVQFGFWLTPIFWNIQLVPEKYRWLLELNPMYYIVSGYRDSVVAHVAFWEKGSTLYFWSITLVIVALGINVFKKLKPHFAEVV